jgi:hypothetical protein
MKWIIAFLAGLMLACIVRADDPFRVVSRDPFTSAKIERAPAKAACPCNCGCADGDCDCVHCQCPSCPGQFQYTQEDGFTYEFKAGKHTGRAWDTQGRLWIKGQLANPSRIVRAARGGR